MMSIKQSVLSAVTIAAGLALVSCAQTKVTGGGWITAKNNEAGKANFGFNGDSCRGNVRGQFNYHDQSADLKAQGDVVAVADCSTGGEQESVALQCLVCNIALQQYSDGNPIIAVRFDYRSTNPRYRGNGEGFACVIDNGEGYNASSADFAAIAFRGGPYDGYINKGSVQGNIQEHSCRANEN